jgi:hypothetical protein
MAGWWTALFFCRASVSVSLTNGVTCKPLVSWPGQRDKKARELEGEWARFRPD